MTSSQIISAAAVGFYRCPRRAKTNAADAHSTGPMVDIGALHKKENLYADFPNLNSIWRQEVSGPLVCTAVVSAVVAGTGGCRYRVSEKKDGIAGQRAAIRR